MGERTNALVLIFSRYRQSQKVPVISVVATGGVVPRIICLLIVQQVPLETSGIFQTASLIRSARSAIERWGGRGGIVRDEQGPVAGTDEAA